MVACVCAALHWIASIGFGLHFIDRPSSINRFFRFTLLSDEQTNCNASESRLHSLRMEIHDAVKCIILLDRHLREEKKKHWNVWTVHINLKGKKGFCFWMVDLSSIVAIIQYPSWYMCVFFFSLRTLCFHPKATESIYFWVIEYAIHWTRRERERERKCWRLHISSFSFFYVCIEWKIWHRYLTF